MSHGTARPVAPVVASPGRPGHRRSEAVMGTIVTIDVPPHAGSVVASAERDAALDRAFGWFRHIEGVCTRFDPASELMALSRAQGTPTAISPLLFEAVRFALAIAAETGGAFDPTVGARMEAAGFNRDHRTRRTISAGAGTDGDVSYRDVELDEATQTVTLHRPLVLDLGGVAKGLAVDVAARELAPLQHFAIDAGGDLYLAGRNGVGAPWSVGIRHPTLDDQLLDTVEVSDEGVCTSGLYERRPASGAEASHIVDPRATEVAPALISATVVSSSTMLADAFATAAFVLGPVEGLALLRRHGARGVLVTTALERLTTEGSSRDRADIA